MVGTIALPKLSGIRNVLNSEIRREVKECDGRKNDKGGRKNGECEGRMSLKYPSCARSKSEVCEEPVVDFAAFAGGLSGCSESSSPTGSDIGALLLDDSEETAVRMSSSVGSTVPEIPEMRQEAYGLSNLKRFETPSDFSAPSDCAQVLLVLDDLDSDSDVFMPTNSIPFPGHFRPEAIDANKSVDSGVLADNEDTSMSTANLSLDFDKSTIVNLSGDCCRDSRPRKLGSGDSLLFEAVARIFVPSAGVAVSMRKEATMLLSKVPDAPPPTPMEHMFPRGW